MNKRSGYMGEKIPSMPAGPKIDKLLKPIPRPLGNHAPVAATKKSIPSTPVPGKKGK